MGRGRTLSPFLMDFALTAATSVIGAICLLLITRLIATRCGPEDLGIYVLFRRIGAFLVPTSTLMIGIGLTRAVALGNPPSRNVVPAATALGLPGTALTSLILLLASAFQDRLPAAAAQSAVVVLPLVAFLFANLIFTVAFAWYRGSSRMRRANAWQLACTALVPLAATLFAAGRAPIQQLLYIIALSYALPIFVFVRLSWPSAGTHPRDIIPGIRELARYCLPRVPGSLGLTAILALAPFVAALRLGLTQSGYLGAGQAVFAVSEGGATALSLLLLPKLTSLLSEGRTSEIRARVSEMSLFLLQVGIPLTAVLPLFAPEIVQLWLGDRYLPAANVMRIYCAGLFPYISYVALRSVLDATEVRALSTVSILTALGLQVVALAAATTFSATADYYAATTTLAMTMLGALSYFFVWRRGHLQLTRSELLTPVLGTVLMALPVLGVELLMRAGFSPHLRVLAKLAAASVGAAVYVALLRRGDCRWISALRRRIDPK